MADIVLSAHEPGWMARGLYALGHGGRTSSPNDVHAEAKLMVVRVESLTGLRRPAFGRAAPSR